MAQRGGMRPGAGRKPGKIGEAKRALAEMAKDHAPKALQTLAEIAATGQSEAARVSAANALLDRAYGRPPQSVEHTGDGGGPIKAQVTLDVGKLSTTTMKELLDASANEG